MCESSESLKLSVGVEQRMWDEYVHLCMERGNVMRVAIDQADEFIRARRARAAESSKLKPTHEQLVVMLDAALEVIEAGGSHGAARAAMVEALEKLS